MFYFRKGKRGKSTTERKRTRGRQKERGISSEKARNSLCSYLKGHP